MLQPEKDVGEWLEQRLIINGGHCGQLTGKSKDYKETYGAKVSEL